MWTSATGSMIRGERNMGLVKMVWLVACLCGTLSDILRLNDRETRQKSRLSFCIFGFTQCLAFSALRGC